MDKNDHRQKLGSNDHLILAYDDLKAIIAREDDCTQQLDNKLIAIITLNIAIITIITTFKEELSIYGSLGLIPILVSIIICLIAALWPRDFSYIPSNEMLLKYVQLLSIEEKDNIHDYLHRMLNIDDHCKLCKVLDGNTKLRKLKSKSLKLSLISMIIGVLAYVILQMLFK